MSLWDALVGVYADEHPALWQELTLDLFLGGDTIRERFAKNICRTTEEARTFLGDMDKGLTALYRTPVTCQPITVTDLRAMQVAATPLDSLLSLPHGICTNACPKCVARYLLDLTKRAVLAEECGLWRTVTVPEALALLTQVRAARAELAMSVTYLDALLKEARKWADRSEKYTSAFPVRRTQQADPVVTQRFLMDSEIRDPGSARQVPVAPMVEQVVQAWRGEHPLPFKQRRTADLPPRDIQNGGIMGGQRGIKA